MSIRRGPKGQVLVIGGLERAMDLTAVLDRFEVLAGFIDLALDLAAPRDALAGCGELDRQRRRLAERTTEALEERLAAGADLTDVAAEAAAAVQLADPESALSRAVDRAERRRLRAAVDAAEAAVDPAQAFAHCQGAATRAIEQVKALRGALRGITTPGEATAAGADTAQAWAVYERQLQVWRAAHEAVRLLRGCGWLPPLPKDAPRGASQYARYDRLADAVGRRELLDASYDDAQPGLYDAAQVAQHVAQVEAEQREAAQREAREAAGAGQG